MDDDPTIEDEIREELSQLEDREAQFAAVVGVVAELARIIHRHHRTDLLEVSARALSRLGDLEGGAEPQFPLEDLVLYYRQKILYAAMGDQPPAVRVLH